MRALVTGASGFLGRRVLALLESRGDVECVAVSRSGTRPDGRRVHALDLEDRRLSSQFASDVGDFDAVFHFSAAVPGSFTGPDAERSMLANIAQTQSATACLAPGGHLVYASSTAVYGTGWTGIADDATTCPAPDHPYAIGKLAGEALSLAAARRGSGTCTVLRISAPYGPGQPTRTVLQVFVERAAGGLSPTYHGSGSRTQDFTFADDVALAAIRAWERRVHGVVNVASGAPISMRDLGALVQEAAGSAALPCASGQPDPQESFRAHYATARMREWLGIQHPTPLRQGIEELLFKVRRPGPA